MLDWIPIMHSVAQGVHLHHALLLISSLRYGLPHSVNRNDALSFVTELEMPPWLPLESEIGGPLRVEVFFFKCDEKMVTGFGVGLLKNYCLGWMVC